MEPVRKAFEALAERIGRSLLTRGDHAAAKHHFTRLLEAGELQKTEFMHAALGLTCFELGEVDCASEHLGKAAAAGTGATAREVLGRAQRLLKTAAEEPAAYGQLFQLVGLWRGIAPTDDGILTVAAAAARQDPAGLQRWLHGTADCGIQAHAVQALQHGAPNEPYLEEAQAALTCDPGLATAQGAVATANYRLAVRAWNELAERPPANLAAAAPRIESVRTHLALAAGAERAPELGRKLDEYEAALQEKERQQAAIRKREAEAECASVLDRAKWALEQSRIAITDLNDIVQRTRQACTDCTSHLDDGRRAELDAALPLLENRLRDDCDAEYYRLPDLPSDPSGLGRDQVARLRSQIETFHRACEPFVASSFRAEKVESLLKRLDAAHGSP
jgi:hypothetical protein